MIFSIFQCVILILNFHRFSVIFDHFPCVSEMESWDIFTFREAGKTVFASFSAIFGDFGRFSVVF